MKHNMTRKERLLRKSKRKRKISNAISNFIKTVLNVIFIITAVLGILGLDVKPLNATYNLIIAVIAGAIRLIMDTAYHKSNSYEKTSSIVLGAVASLMILLSYAQVLSRGV